MSTQSMHLPSKTLKPSVGSAQWFCVAGFHDPRSRKTTVYGSLFNEAAGIKFALIATCDLKP